MTNFKKVKLEFNLVTGTSPVEEMFRNRNINFSVKKLEQEILIPQTASLESGHYSITGPIWLVKREESILYTIFLNLAESYLQIRKQDSTKYQNICFAGKKPAVSSNYVIKNIEKNWGLTFDEKGWYFTEKIPISYGDIFFQEIILPEKWVCFISDEYKTVWEVLNEKEELVIRLHFSPKISLLCISWKDEAPSQFIRFSNKKCDNFKCDDFIFFENGLDPWGLKLDENGYSFIISN